VLCPHNAFDSVTCFCPFEFLPLEPRLQLVLFPVLTCSRPNRWLRGSSDSLPYPGASYAFLSPFDFFACLTRRLSRSLLPNASPTAKFATFSFSISSGCPSPLRVRECRSPRQRPPSFLSAGTPFSVFVLPGLGKAVQINISLAFDLSTISLYIQFPGGDGTSPWARGPPGDMTEPLYGSFLSRVLTLVSFSSDDFKPLRFFCGDLFVPTGGRFFHLISSKAAAVVLSHT